MIGDDQYPADVEYTGKAIKDIPDWVKSNKDRPVKERVTFTTWKHFSKDDPLIESGLLGPVTIEVRE